jgi:hypothetical protein
MNESKIDTAAAFVLIEGVYSTIRAVYYLAAHCDYENEHSLETITTCIERIAPQMCRDLDRVLRLLGEGEIGNFSTSDER